IQAMIPVPRRDSGTPMSRQRLLNMVKTALGFFHVQRSSNHCPQHSWLRPWADVAVRCADGAGVRHQRRLETVCHNLPGGLRLRVDAACLTSSNCNFLPRSSRSMETASPQAGEDIMTAFNSVRFKVKPGRDQEFLDAHSRIDRDWPGLRAVNLIKTGDRDYCVIGEWDDMDSLSAARPHMIATLDSFRDTLEELGDGNVTDP